jgi:hypothetical protein
MTSHGLVPGFRNKCHRCSSPGTRRFHRCCFIRIVFATAQDESSCRTGCRQLARLELPGLEEATDSAISSTAEGQLRVAVICADSSMSASQIWQELRERQKGSSLIKIFKDASFDSGQRSPYSDSCTSLALINPLLLDASPPEFGLRHAHFRLPVPASGGWLCSRI